MTVEAPAAAPRRVPVWVKALLSVVGAATVLLGAAVLWIYAEMSGGWDNAFRWSTVSEDDAHVRQAHDRVRVTNQDLLQQVVAGPVAQAVPGSTTVATAQADVCSEGQHDWKRDDPYDLQCGLADATLLVGHDLFRFRSDMVALDAALTEAGWEAQNQDITDVMTGYWDDRDRVEASSELRYPARLPAVDYADAEGRRLVIEWVHHGSVGPLGYGYELDQWVAADGRTVGVQALEDAVPEGRYGVVVEVMQEYFRE